MPYLAYTCEIRHNPSVKPVVWMGSSREDLRGFPESVQDSLGFGLYRIQCGLEPTNWKPMSSVGAGVKEVRVRDEAGIFRMIYLATRPEGICAALLPEEISTDEPRRPGIGEEAVEVDCEEVMRAKKVISSEHGPRHVTPAGRSVFYDLFPAEKAAEMEMRAQLLMGLEHWLEKNRMTQAEAAKILGVTQARVSDLKRGKIDRFSMDLLVRLAARAGLKPKLKLAA